MGCTPSKQPVCRNCNAQYSPVRRSYSSYSYHSPPRDSDLSHVVSLNSTTLGYLLLDPTKPNVPENSLKDVAVEMIETKTWNKMIDKKIAKSVQDTPVATPPGELETINAWELMEGLDDLSPIQLTSTVDHIHLNSIPLDEPAFTFPSEEKDQHDELACKPLKIQFMENKSPLCSNSNVFIPSKSLQNEKNENIPRSKEKLVLYFTSLRGVRKTYEDSCHARVILKNSLFRVDERDVSMHSGFKEELNELLGDQYNGGELPKVFIGKKYIGGVDEIRRFHDELMLDKVFEGCETAIGHSEGCDGCGDVRFVLCETCSGSCKIYYEVNSDEGEKEEIDESDYGFQRCPDCNENGLVRCPICCD